jgi:para-nitrobenzyl esterase
LLYYLYPNPKKKNMKKNYLAIVAGVLLFSSITNMNAQCGSGRFHNFVFLGSTVTSAISYGSNLTYSNTAQNLVLDVYQPTGDTSTRRPLVIIAHGGSFVGGGRTGTDVVPLCQDLAKLGYVTASIDYRLGMTRFPVGGPPDSTDAGAAVMRAVHDGRAAIRFFRKNAAIGGNTYKIDTNNIYFAGVSAGAFIALHIAYMNQLSDFPSYVDTTGTGTIPQYGLHGGIEGLSGNPGYSSKIKAIVNICGALGDTAWMHHGDTPILSFHGTNDGTVPFGTAEIYLLGTYPLLKVNGSSTITLKANQVGIENCFDIYWGQDHIPEVGTSPSNIAYYDTTLVITRNWLEHQVCGIPLNCSYTARVTGINELSVNAENINAYPNPASTAITIDLSAFTGHTINIQLYDGLGRQIKNITNIKTDQYIIGRDNLPAGIYFMNVIADGKVYSKKIMFE